jgi:hypothetical protein
MFGRGVAAMSADVSQNKQNVPRDSPSPLLHVKWSPLIESSDCLEARQCGLAHCNTHFESTWRLHLYFFRHADPEHEYNLNRKSPYQETLLYTLGRSDVK